MRQRLRVAGNQPADLVDARMPGVSRAQTPAAEDVGREQQQARDVGRLERAREAGEQTFRARCFDEIRERRYIDHIQQTAFVPARRVQQHASEARVSHQRDEVRIEAFIGENHAENLDAARNVCSAPRCAPPASRLAPGRPRRSPLLHRPCPSPLPRERQAPSRPARQLRSPAAARSPPRRSRAQHPAERRANAPSGSRRSMMSAPCAIAISASCGPLTLASIKVIGLAFIPHSAVVLDIGVALVVFRRAFERAAALARAPVHHVLDLLRQFKILIRDALGGMVLQPHLD